MTEREGYVRIFKEAFMLSSNGCGVKCDCNEAFGLLHSLKTLDGFRCSVLTTNGYTIIICMSDFLGKYVFKG